MTSQFELRTDVKKKHEVTLRKEFKSCLAGVRWGDAEANGASKANKAYRRHFVIKRG